MTPGLTARKSTEFIVVHCSASVPDIKTDAKVIDRWHRQRGFLMLGYHYVIKTDGIIEPGRDPESIGAHVAGYNHNSIGICMVGGVDRDQRAVNNFTPEQFSSLTALVQTLHEKYPDAVIQGHRDFPKVVKACPCFDVKLWVAKNIQYLNSTRISK